MVSNAYTGYFIDKTILNATISRNGGDNSVVFDATVACEVKQRGRWRPIGIERFWLKEAIMTCLSPIIIIKDH
jgi:hypothetical protein